MKTLGLEVVCFIPCCSSKSAGVGLERPPYAWPDRGLERARARLVVARRGMEHCIEGSSRPTPAMHLYSGSFYSALDAGLARQLIYSGKLRLFIISAGYGVLDAFEPARNYDAEMKGRVARYWREAGLADIIGDICLVLSPQRVYGFFAGEPGWSGSGAKYRYFFTEGVKKALSSGFKPAQAGCFYRESGRGVTAILGALGRAFYRCLSSGPNCDMIVEAAKTSGLRDGGIIIRYQDFLAAGEQHRA
ncbi:peroxide stress protein YaaA [Desulfofundulus thermobenzoicus]|uniref:Peroxide stress protein YaaA n=1 Tax=Desulfofundulus thermobenzoicus TaxID=29376 RepID=A0A6N7ILQ0_9FIRM|nr:peroxide stress protein YaaA [Desulfofundulus thermobenzoicus]